MREGTLLLSAEMVSRCISIKDVIRDTEEAILAHGLGRVAMPAKITLDLRPFGLTGWCNAMPAYVDGRSVYGIKWAGGFIDNPRLHELSFVVATIILNDPETGFPLAVMDGAVITNMRTGAASAVAAKDLARHDSPPTVAILGAGAQGRSSALALSATQRLGEVRVTDIRSDASDRFRRDLEERVSGPVRVVATGEEAVEGADIVVTATAADTPLFPARVARSGVFVASLGSYPELDPALILDVDEIVVDSLEQNIHRGELVRLFAERRLKPEDICAELGDVIAGKKPGRESSAERIVACLIGIASEDISVAATVYRRAIDLGMGEYFSFLD